MRGTPEAYKNLAVKDNDTLYFISTEKSSDGALYLGSKLISGESEGLSSFSLNELKDVLISEGLSDRSLLIYDNGKWKDVAPDDFVFIGASTEANGLAGLVPAPSKGKTDLFLRSDGQWAELNVTTTLTADQNIITIENEDETNLHADLIQAAIGIDNIDINKGDIAIIKDLIAENKWHYTSYVYNGEHWTAMDGNYNAENVYFEDDFRVTATIGTITELTNGQAILPAKGKNLFEVFSDLLAQRQKPKVTLPYATISLNNSGVYEVGTTLIPEWKTTFYKGKYSYGPETEVEDVGGIVTSTHDANEQVILAGALANATGLFESCQVTDDTVYKAYLTYGWNNDSVNPIDNFGDECSDLKITLAENKNATSGNSITGYRAWFKGGLNTYSHEQALDSNTIRNSLEISSTAISSHTFEMKASDYEDCKRIIIAIPVNTNKKVQQVYLKSSSNADITSEFIKQTSTLDIEGAEGFTAKPYNVWIYEPAQLDATEIYTITIS